MVSYLFHFYQNYLGMNAINFLIKSVLPIFFGIIVYNAVPYINKSIFVKYLKLFLLLTILFVIMQFFGMWSINTFFFANDMIENIQNTTNYVGISSSPFYMGSQLAIITPIILGYSNRTKLVTFLFILTSYFSGQRAYFLSILFYSLRSRINIFYSIFLMIFFFIVSIYLMQSQYFSFIFRGYDFDRIILYFAGINYILEYPFGVGGFAEYKENVGLVSSSNEFLSSYLGKVSSVPAPHNFLINSAMIHGVLILFPLGYFLVKIYQLNNLFSWGFLLGVIVSMFHNLSFIYGDFFSWIILAFSLTNKNDRKF